jgi:hypothetical protein
MVVFYFLGFAIFEQKTEISIVTTQRAQLSLLFSFKITKNGNLFDVALVPCKSHSNTTLSMGNIVQYTIRKALD